MDGFGLEFDHFGLATRQPEITLSFLRALGYRTHDPVHDPLQLVDLVLCRSPTMPAVEVISSADAANPLMAVLAAQPQAIYHLCYRSQNLAASLAAMKAAGHRVLRVSEPKPAVLFDNKEVSFYMVRGFGMLEIIET
jgi:methylmalonyl-CoA/ethylmalonyl-CoA epimerase